MTPEQASWESCKMQLQAIHEDVCEIKAELKKLNGTVRQTEKEVAVLNDWRASQVNTALGQVSNLRVEMARMGAMGTMIGVVIGGIMLVGRALGVL